MNKSKRQNLKGILLLCLLGLMLRVSLASVYVHWDTIGFKLQAVSLQTMTFREMYTNFPGGYTPYLPLHYYILYPISLIFKVLHYNQFTPGYFPNLIIKIPVYTAQILTGYLIWWIVRQKLSNKQALIAAGSYLFHPAILNESIIVGQVDGIIIFLLLLALTLLNNRKLYLSFLTMSLGLLIKPLGLIMVPLFVITSLSNFPVKKLVLPGILATLLTFAIYYPFTIGMGYLWVYQFTKKFADTYLFTSVYALNIWSLEGFMLSDLRKFIGLPLKKWGLYTIYGLLGLLFGITIYTKTKIKNQVLYFLALLSFYITYLFATRMEGGRFLTYILAFYPLIFWLKKRFIIAWIISSLVILVNTIFVYNQFSLPFARLFSENKIVVGILLSFHFVALGILLHGYLRLIFTDAFPKGQYDMSTSLLISCRKFLPKIRLLKNENYQKFLGSHD